MKNELLHFFVPEKGRRTKRQPISWLCCWAILLGMVCNACSDDDPVKKNPYLQVSTRAMLKEVVEVKFNNIDGNTDITVDFGDGTVKEGKAATPITYAYTQSGDYTLHVTAGQYEVQKRIRIYNLLSLTEAMKQFREPDNKKVWVMTHRAHTSDRTVPENSVSSVEDAIDSGAEVIECDTHVTSDGVVVVCHDQTINATTNGTGDITKMTYAEIQKYNLKDRNGRVTDEKMPTLEEFLKAGRGRIYYNLDYSPRTATSQQVVDIVMKLDMMESVFFYCNSAQKAEEVLGITPKAHVYTWTGSHKPMIGLPGNYFVQYSYLTNGKSTPLGSSINDGMLATVNMLPASGSSVSEWTLNETYLDELLQCSLGLRQCPDHQTVEASILPHHKFRYAIFRDMALYGFKQSWVHPIRRLPVPYKKAASHLTALIHSRSHILLVVIHNRNIKLAPILIIISLIIRCVKRKLMI